MLLALSDVNLDILAAPIPLFPLLAGYCRGLLCGPVARVAPRTQVVSIITKLSPNRNTLFTGNHVLHNGQHGSIYTYVRIVSSTNDSNGQGSSENEQSFQYFLSYNNNNLFSAHQTVCLRVFLRIFQCVSDYFYFPW